jgi:hypothetical protein
MFIPMASELLIINICTLKINSQVIYCSPYSRMGHPCQSFQAPEEQNNFVSSLLKIMLSVMIARFCNYVPVQTSLPNKEVALI